MILQKYFKRNTMPKFALEEMLKSNQFETGIQSSRGIFIFKNNFLKMVILVISKKRLDRNSWSFLWRTFKILKMHPHINLIFDVAWRIRHFLRKRKFLRILKSWLIFKFSKLFQNYDLLIKHMPILILKNLV